MTRGGDLDRLVERWADREGLSEHLRLELSATAELKPGDPVPGCGCPRCVTYAAGGDEEDAAVAAFLVRTLAECSPEDRREAAEALAARWVEVGCTLPRPGVLAELAKRVPGAVRSLPDDADPLPVEEARRVPILDVCRRLGLGEPVRPYPSSRELRVLCPLHADTNPSLTLSPDKGLAGVWFCFPCGIGGDGIELVMRAKRMEFHEAVKWLTAGS